MEIKVCATQEAGPFWGPERGYNRGNFGCLKNIPLTNQWPECTDIWYEATFGQRDSGLCNKVPGVRNGPTPRKGPKKGKFFKNVLMTECKYIWRGSSQWHEDI